MRALWALGIGLLAASAKADRVLLIPLDSRPATGQFAQMIGRMADVDVVLPPAETLGRFTTPGTPDEILDWLSTQDLSDVTAVVASSDMVSYGGLISSRTGGISRKSASDRLKRLSTIVHRSSETRLYVFSATMRLAPTATRLAADWRLKLSKYVELRDRYHRTGEKELMPTLKRLSAELPKGELKKYSEVRARDHRVQLDLIEMAADGRIDTLVVGQDDAKPFGPHVAETRRMRAIVDKRELGNRVRFCEGIDQHANVLLSRALLSRARWTPSVRTVYANNLAADRVAAFESQPIFESLRGQIEASGARMAFPGENADYTLYVNTPGSTEAELGNLVRGLESESGPTALADINHGPVGGSDPRLVDALERDARTMDLVSYAGWNTAGNTLGTTIPAANVYLVARLLDVNPVGREVARREFLLHRFVNDYGYHRFTRPQAYELLDILPDTSREETYGTSLAQVNAFVQRDLGRRLGETFRTQLFGRRFEAGGAEYVFTGLNGVHISLPWPRAYEVRMEFRLETQPTAR
ncbi:DUF4127 family protein [bacterium]|nr:MAG: DUF4127 family protein [bacterium]